LFFAASANAGVPSPSQSEAAGPATLKVIQITPAALGSNLGAVGATVTVTVRDGNGDVIVGYPFQDMSLDCDIDVQLNFCPGGSTADGNTDINGQSTFSGNLAGGGWSTAGLRVLLGGTPVTNGGGIAAGLLDIDVNSADLNGDRTVNIADVGNFAADFGAGVYSFRSDLVADGVLNIADVGNFATHVQEVCP
jgi:hypothetical protein